MYPDHQNHNPWYLVALLGGSVALLMTLTVVRPNIFGGLNISTQSLQQAEQTSADTNKPVKADLRSPNPKAIAVTEEKLDKLDKAITEESSKRITQSDSSPSANANQGFITSRIQLIQSELNRTTSMKEYLPENEYNAIITELQKALNQLEKLNAQYAVSKDRTVLQSVANLKIYDVIARTAQLRRFTAHIYKLNESIASRNQTLNALNEEKYKLTGNTSLYNETKTCIQQAEQTRITGLGYLNGVLSQLGLINTLEKKDIAPLENRLRTQLTNARKELTTARNASRQCQTLFGKI